MALDQADCIDMILHKFVNVSYKSTHRIVVDIHSRSYSRWRNEKYCINFI